tara:strand:+ start:478 stop:771 length:294 start_codon:yes stop_codon:yes gene_type:complete
LNLVVNTIFSCNTVYLSRATTRLRQQGRHIPDELLKHVSPLSWEHINITGIYSWDAEQQMSDSFRELRFPEETCAPHEVHTSFDLSVRFSANLVPPP